MILWILIKSDYIHTNFARLINNVRNEHPHHFILLKKKKKGKKEFSIKLNFFNTCPFQGK